MGDHRADIKIEFTIHGKTYKQSWFINYFDDGDGVDSRISDWFRKCWHNAKSRHDIELDKLRDERE